MCRGQGRPPESGSPEAGSEQLACPSDQDALLVWIAPPGGTEITSSAQGNALPPIPGEATGRYQGCRAAWLRGACSGPAPGPARERAEPSEGW